MGTTLHAIVEVFYEGAPGVRRSMWDSVCSWDLDKDYALSIALDGLTDKGWPATERDSFGRPLDPWGDPEVSWARRKVDEQDVADNRRWTTLARLLETDLEGPFVGRFEAIVDACTALARHCGDVEKVRVLFYSIP